MAATTTTPAPYHPHTSHFSPPSHPSTPRLMNMGPPEHRERTYGDTTPTRSDFGGIPGQRPLPTTPVSPSDIVNTPDTDKSDSDPVVSRSGHKGHDSEDLEMADDDGVDSDNESNASDSKPRKKKKGQRFYCTDFPPCNLSFTRSEHLARHVRKHTGERPYQCHCSRRFSRLDNLRQHAQTVHVNEEIPVDSLAASNSRFQRQIRTDRVRAPGARSRAGTAGSIGHARGHSRNLSSSSMASTVSNISLIPEDTRRRPPPLAMSGQPVAQGRIPIEAYGTAGGQPGQYTYYPSQSQTGYSTPPPATYSTGGNSPRFHMQSPSLAPRAAYYPASESMSSRRLSVPSGASPYSPGPTNAYPATYHGPPPPAGGYHQSTASTSSIHSPTSSVYSHLRRDTEAELDWRRRTWHPGTYAAHVQRPPTSGLMYQQTPDDARPTTAHQPAASQITRLPGIESFDHAASAAPVAPRSTSPMQLDSSGRPVYAGPADGAMRGPDNRRSTSMWESSLHQNLNRLDIANATPPRSSINAPRPRAPLPVFHFPQAPATVEEAPAPAAANAGPSKENLSVHNNRRQGWYGGPTSQPINIAQRRSPEGSCSSDGVVTPSTSHGTEIHPAIVHSNGMVVKPGTLLTEEQQRALEVERTKPETVRNDSGSHIGRFHSGSQSTPYALYPDSNRVPSPSTRPPPNHNDMGRLEALVAVATSENAHR